jgi:hypothetical protein
MPRHGSSPPTAPPAQPERGQTAARGEAEPAAQRSVQEQARKEESNELSGAVDGWRPDDHKTQRVRRRLLIFLKSKGSFSALDPDRRGALTDLSAPAQVPVTTRSFPREGSTSLEELVAQATHGHTDTRTRQGISSACSSRRTRTHSRPSSDFLGHSSWSACWNGWRWACGRANSWTSTQTSVSRRRAPGCAGSSSPDRGGPVHIGNRYSALAYAIHTRGSVRRLRRYRDCWAGLR